MHLSNLNSVLQSEDAENAASTDALSWLYHPWLVLNVVDVPAYNALSGILEHTTLRAESVGRSRNKRWTSYLENETKWHDTKQWSDFAAVVKSAEQEYAYAEMNRIAGLEANRDNAMRPLALAWENIFSAESYRPNLSKVHWMMSEHEDALRRRILKRINVAFDDHKSASYYESKKMPVIKKAPQADGKVIVSRESAESPASPVLAVRKGSAPLQRSHSMISRDSADSIRSADSRRRSMPMVALEALLKPIQDPRNAVVSTPEPKVPGEQSGSSSDSEAEPSISEQPQDVRITWTLMRIVPFSIGSMRLRRAKSSFM